MIQYLKPFKINKNDIENIKNVRPFWDKEINKKVKNLKKWLLRFQKTDANFKLNMPHDYNDYINFFSEILSYNNFINQKTKQIKTSIKIYSKFYKMYLDYSFLLGWTKFIETLSIYYNNLKNEDVSNLAIHYLKLTNETLYKFLDIYKKEINKIIPEDEYINLLLDDIVINDKEILVVNEALDKIVKYVKLLYRKKKVDEKTLLKVSSSTLELVYFNYSYSLYSYKLLKNLSY
ncbi:hypothetical protein [Spiroplasma turonicum]|uniref:Uncharacterized protein n=1 Tax=Spiroplasma turonicum TaxID=216946 RepID=A0A0K1P5U0_9MOLU|nr:hypothetical protein [Spiroplasma turonicum]AKU79620.1 hypothetical protein STURON_00374 [Spiroplasma turonicum]ALX70642.1 hypothetical protein STURO_v1c03740 [Spiroplasma turonicum]